VGDAQVTAALVHSTEGCDATQATSFVFISAALIVLRLLGKWKKLQVANVHVFPSYALRQHMSVKRLGCLFGCGKISPGWSNLAAVSVANWRRIDFLASLLLVFYC
jgi:hypothetical protein